MNQRAGKRFRLKRRKDIQRLFDEGARSSVAVMTLLAAPNGLDCSRLAVGVSVRHGNAVARNRVKRLCREAFRLIRSELPEGRDYMIIPRAGAKPAISGLQASLRKLAPRVAAVDVAKESGR